MYDYVEYLSVSKKIYIIYMKCFKMHAYKVCIDECM